MANILVDRIELRFINTNYGKLAYSCLYLSETLDKLDSGDIVQITGNDFMSMQGSVLQSITSADDSTHISPVSVGDTLEYNNTVFSSSRNAMYEWRMLKDGDEFFTMRSDSTRVFATMFAVHTSDGYTSYYFVFYGRLQTYQDTFTLTPATSNRFGYFVVNVPWSNNLDMCVVNTEHYFNTPDDIFNQSTTTEETDPYVNGGGASGGGGGTGDFDDTSDTIGIPSLPTVSGLNTGFFTAFVCTQSQLQAVSAYLWNNVIDDILDVDTGFSEKIDALKKVVANPYDAIMGCSLVPVSPPMGGSKEMKMYGIVKTGISLPYASSRWVSVDCGTLNIHEFWGSYLDYSPYTKTTSLYLPYIGVVSVDIDLIMAKALQVVYHVDILSGICIAYIVVDGSVKFQYQGHCSTTIPITSSDYSGSIQAGLGLVGNVSNIVAGGISGGVSGGPVGAAVGAVGSAISQAPSIASNVMSMKPDIKSGGGVGSSGGILGVQKPYLIIERPRQSVPERQNHFTGYPSNMHATIGSLSGYTEFERVNIDGITLTDEEKAELENILKGGVYL